MPTDSETPEKIARFSGHFARPRDLAKVDQGWSCRHTIPAARLGSLADPTGPGREETIPKPSFRSSETENFILAHIHNRLACDVPGHSPGPKRCLATTVRDHCRHYRAPLDLDATGNVPVCVNLSEFEISEIFISKIRFSQNITSPGEPFLRALVPAVLLSRSSEVEPRVLYIVDAPECSKVTPVGCKSLW